MNNKRVKWIDIAKGIGIILVVLGHSNWFFAQATTTMFIQKYIYSFHMPLFFFLSGYLFIKEKYPSFKAFFIKKVKTLLIPYFFFSILSVLFIVILNLKNLDNLISFKTAIIQIFYLKSTVVWNEPLWFLVCLFVVEIIYYFLSKIKSKKIIVFILLLCSITGYSLSFIINYFILPWGVGIALIAIAFYGIGNFVRGNETLNKITLPNVPVFIICLIISVVIGGFLNSIIVMYLYQFGNIFYLYIGAVAGIIACIQLSQFISKQNIIIKLFEYYGKNSIVILCTHYFIFKILKRINVLNIIFENCISVKGYAYAFITLVICIPIIFIMNKYFSFILGKKANKTLEISK